MLIVGSLAMMLAAASPAFGPLREAAIFRSRRFLGWLSAAAIATYFLLLTGSYVTRSGASLACPSFPLCGPSSPAVRRLADIQMLHRFTAYGVTVLAAVLVIWLLTRQEDQRLMPFAYVLGALFVIQLLLGVSNVLLSLPMWSRVLHLTVATCFWGGLVMLWSLSRPRQAAAVTPD
jgi:heme A synthase